VIIAMLINEYDLKLFTPPCEPGAAKWTAEAQLKVDISEVLPYLNAALRGAVYNRAANALTWTKGGRNVAFHARRIMAANLADRAEAERVIRGLVDLVNRTWERRNELQPDFEMHRRAAPMEIYQLLPKTNCGQCGQPTCFTFALQLVAGQKEPEDCPPLREPACAEQLATLRERLGDMPALG
jgi:ArsR family metal-binding transcriptional regulator